MFDGHRKESYLVGKERDEGLGNDANQHTRLKKERGTPTPISQHMRTPTHNPARQ